MHRVWTQKRFNSWKCSLIRWLYLTYSDVFKKGFLYYQNHGLKFFFIDFKRMTTDCLFWEAIFKFLKKKKDRKHHHFSNVIPSRKMWFRHDTFFCPKNQRCVFCNFFLFFYIARHLSYNFCRESFATTFIVELSFLTLWTALKIKVHFVWFRNVHMCQP